jgi:hypothetical protein
VKLLYLSVTGSLGRPCYLSGSRPVMGVLGCLTASGNKVGGHFMDVGFLGGCQRSHWEIHCDCL